MFTGPGSLYLVYRPQLPLYLLIALAAAVSPNASEVAHAVVVNVVPIMFFVCFQFRLENGSFLFDVLKSKYFQTISTYASSTFVVERRMAFE